MNYESWIMLAFSPILFSAFVINIRHAHSNQLRKPPPKELFNRERFHHWQSWTRFELGSHSAIWAIWLFGCPISELHPHFWAEGSITELPNKVGSIRCEQERTENKDSEQLHFLIDAACSQSQAEWAMLIEGGRTMKDERWALIQAQSLVKEWN